MDGNLYHAYMQSCKFVLDIVMPAAKIIAIYLILDIGFSLSFFLKRMRKKMEDEDNGKRRLM